MLYQLSYAREACILAADVALPRRPTARGRVYLEAAV